ncbi:serine/threonine protein kinase [Hydrogenothermus marinus]|uniref:Putative serine/threonine protein kinase n=1 Tax=Hydrogenothermus marinus TaxID=133270 RepID=A0A3M0C2U3_9AQUI|nr:serine/threonine protein kinase [Hydrogenothermus marinus]RMA97272.1 putative serine/threonine protein kinase [Hydrogenothermus marinus]
MNFKDIKDKIRNLQLIGKGWRGTVYKGVFDGKTLAFKIPNKEEHKKAIQKEGEILSIVNKHKIGGKLHIKGEDFIAYSFIEGKPLKDVLNKENYKNLILQLFQQARTLDKLKINKDEFQRPLKNALVDDKGKVHLIDFERAKFSEKVSNITQLLQFINSLEYFNIEKEKLIKLGKEYKNFPTDKNYEKILKTIFKENNNGF